VAAHFSTDDIMSKPAASHPPAYREAGKTYYADSCQPLVDAVRAGQVRLSTLAREGYPGRRLGREQLPGVRSVGYWDAGPKQRWGLPVHRNEGIEIAFMASGQTPVLVESHRQTLSHDQFMITRPWQPHQIGAPCIGSSKLIWLILDVGVRRPHQTWKWPPWIILNREDLGFLTRCLRQNEQYVWPGSEEMRRCWLGIAQAVDEDRGGSRCSRLAVLINEALLALLEIFRERKIPLRQSLASAERTLRLFLGELAAALDQPWTLESMAESCHMKATQFVHHFRKLTNMTPTKYLNHARIERACDLLAHQPGATITEIAFASGFSSSQYFANVFSRQMRCTPRDYRRQTRGQH
jgi:AraC family L-rhamnose operon regulatory protein RhaS